MTVVVVVLDSETEVEIAIPDVESDVESESLFWVYKFYKSYILSILKSICSQVPQTQTVVNITVESFSESAADVASEVARVVMVEVSVAICFMLLLVFN